VAEKKSTKGVARLGFFVARADEGSEAVTDVLCAVWAALYFYLN